MAERRMFTMKIVDSDAFLDMPMSTQCLYFHLNMRADDDGFINNPKKIQRIIGASEDDLRLLLAKRFVIGFENGVVVIKHWRMHNLLRKDRYRPTQYIEEKETLALSENGAYTEKPLCIPVATTGQPCGNQVATQDSIGKDSIGEESIVEDTTAQKRKRFVPPTLEEVRSYCQERKNNVNPEKFIDHYTANGWMVGRNKMKDWKAAVRTWERNSYSEPKDDKSYDSDGFFEAALRAGLEKEPAKTAADDEGIRERMEKLKERLGN